MMATLIIPPEIVERLGGADRLDAFVEHLRQANAASKTPEAMAEALRSHVRALEEHGYDPDHLWPPRSKR